MSAHDEVQTYAPAGVKWWSRPGNGHGPLCPCYVCADTRVFKRVPPLETEILRRWRQRRREALAS